MIQLTIESGRAFSLADLRDALPHCRALAEVDRLRAQLAELRVEHDAHDAAATQYERDIRALRAQLAEAREAFEDISHAPACLLYGGAKCDCGVEALERALALGSREEKT